MTVDFAQLAPLAVIIPFLGAALSLLLLRRNALQRTVAIGSLVLTLAVEALILGTTWNLGPQAVHLGGWEAPWGIVMVVDQLSSLMLVVSTVVSLAVLVYASGQGVADGDEEGPISIFHPSFLILVAGVSNAFLAGDLFNLYVGFEILLTASYVLMTMGGTVQRIRTGVTYVVVSVISSVLFLITIAMIYAATGTINMADLSVKLEGLPVGTQMQLHLMLLIAFGIKAAVFPLSFWLPDSYPTASAPVTAVFAGLLTKVGVYSIIRTETVLFPGERLDDLLMWVALLTMVVGILGALAQIDIKRMLSFTLISHIGYMIFGVAVGTQEALSATVYYVAHHIVIQTSLFLVAGLIERRGGSTNVDRLAGMAKISPLLALLYLVPALNLGGIPPFSGFLGKTGLLQAGVDQGDGLAYALVAGSVAVSLLTLLALIRVWNRVFLRAPEDAEYPDPILLAPVPAGSRFLLTSGAVDDQAGRFAGKGDVRLMSPSMLGGASALVAAGVALTVFAGPLFQLADNAAENLVRPERYVEAVLDPASAPRPVVEEAP
ncbi:MULTISPECIES: Na+/H+ antiporter subunit D [Kocuria]|uniref:Monovalent cation/H+ antiporter subunit D n=1 Tax=Kocuria rosea subsp. polaris TaxID=136273 RepID=A0A0A6VQQ6_KOCRO|nr:MULTISPECIES: Na+/H+ antiporter subunit D [Kocuria]MCC5783910.1 Na+/H+ antiporter subunit D [Kocuria sp. CCUG 69068]KHD96961.1 monovalent cation/H+ antiporter subunit D [Kocuria polaris]PWF83010.1 Na+/H+ antiporter subunit D [Kocuria rosea]PWF85111.1 Na+/H+ antiporter subunit D [Kocuria rosea]THE17340.1 Na+/H+ antiporter subunit D [Kocuria rosea]